MEMNMDRARSAIIVLVVFLFCVVGIRKSALDNIRRIGFNSGYYPKRYVVLPRWIRKRFKIEQRMIPRFSFFELLLAMLFLVCAVGLAIYTLVSANPFDGWHMLLLPCAFILAVTDILVSSIMTRIYLRTKEQH